MFERSVSRWCGRIALATIVPLVVVELVLQVGALFVTRTAPETGPAGEPCLALCVGDSFTFGLGASDPRASYPAQLEAALRVAPIDGRWRVANAGVPGRNSRDVLLDLPHRFRRERPRFVVVLAGINDVWSRPALASIDDTARDDDPTAWHLEWRTRKLVALLLHATRTEEGFAGMGRKVASRQEDGAAAKRAAAAGAPAAAETELDAQQSWQIVGRWTLGGETIVFERDGRLRRGGATLRWSVARAGELRITMEDGSIATVAAKRVGGRLTLALPDSAVPVVLEPAGPAPGAPAEPPPDRYAEFERRFSAKDAAGALEVCERWSAIEPDDPLPYYLHMRAAGELGRRDLYEADRSALERIQREVGTRDAAESLLNGLWHMNDLAGVAQLVREQVDRFPDSGQLRFHLAKADELAGDPESALREMERSLALDPGPAGSWTAFRNRECSRFTSRLGRAADSAAFMIRAARADRSPDLDRQVILSGAYDERALAEAYARTDATPDERAYVERLRAEARATSSSAIAPTLTDHLRQVARWCREQGAEAVFCDYPFREDVIAAAERAAAAAEGFRFVDLTARFDVLLQTHARAELFVPDGHCNDAGYRFMAEEIAAALRAPPPAVHAGPGR